MLDIGGKGGKNMLPKINVAEIPDYCFNNIGDAVSRALKAFYADPKNVEEFEEWKRNRTGSSEGGRE